MKTLAIFPGQGSQEVGMGRDFVEVSEKAKEIFSVADKALGIPLSAYCLEGPADKLVNTAVAQPAILTVSVIAYQLFQEKNSLPITAAAGHSLGEYSALVAAGALKFEDAVVLVNKRGKYMQEAVPRGQGKMLAIIGSELQEIENRLSEIENVVQVANINAPGQIVISGSAEAIDEFQSNFKAKKMVELDVSAPFHCSLMKPAANSLAQDLSKIEISKPTFPIISNFRASAVEDPEEIRTLLIDQVCGRVRWVESMEYAVSTLQIEQVIEFGHGAVLTGLMKRISKDTKRVNVSNPADIG